MFKRLTDTILWVIVALGIAVVVAEGIWIFWPGAKWGSPLSRNFLDTIVPDVVMGTLILVVFSLLAWNELNYRSSLPVVVEMVAKKKMRVLSQSLPGGYPQKWKRLIIDERGLVEQQGIWEYCYGVPCGAGHEHHITETIVEPSLEVLRKHRFQISPNSMKEPDEPETN